MRDINFDLRTFVATHMAFMSLQTWKLVLSEFLYVFLIWRNILMRRRNITLHFLFLFTEPLELLNA